MPCVTLGGRRKNQRTQRTTKPMHKEQLIDAAITRSLNSRFLIRRLVSKRTSRENSLILQERLPGAGLAATIGNP